MLGRKKMNRRLYSFDSRYVGSFRRRNHISAQVDNRHIHKAADYYAGDDSQYISKNIIHNLPRFSPENSFLKYYAAISPAISIFFICKSAFIVCDDRSASVINCPMAAGMTCHETPNLSLSQPHMLSSPPSVSFAQ